MSKLDANHMRSPSKTWTCAGRPRQGAPSDGSASAFLVVSSFLFLARSLSKCHACRRADLRLYYAVLPARPPAGHVAARDLQTVAYKIGISDKVCRREVAEVRRLSRQGRRLIGRGFWQRTVRAPPTCPRQQSQILTEWRSPHVTT